ncbi:hypothetical protein GCM10011495_39620 [Hymenobacter frigidus]|uniref:Lipocalin-like domain-containing protein n=2 Tax=Hymenobacter frigidus TaxID=1524095 RepID=A0ABQ2AHL2_9BACT|nr:hypothetical protein GCM10011495_39620 [Hymenobacter frigidus]
MYLSTHPILAMKFSVMALIGALLLTACSKSAPAPPTLVGIWDLESVRSQSVPQNGSPPRDRTYVATPGESPQEFTADGRVWHQNPGATGSFYPYRFDGTTVVVSLGPFDMQWQVLELSAHRLVYRYVHDGSPVQFTETFTYRR